MIWRVVASWKGPVVRVLRAGEWEVRRPVWRGILVRVGLMRKLIVGV